MSDVLHYIFAKSTIIEKRVNCINMIEAELVESSVKDPLATLLGESIIGDSLISLLGDSVTGIGIDDVGGVTSDGAIEILFILVASPIIGALEVFFTIVIVGIEDPFLGE